MYVKGTHKDSDQEFSLFHVLFDDVGYPNVSVPFYGDDLFVRKFPLHIDHGSVRRTHNRLSLRARPFRVSEKPDLPPEHIGESENKA